MAKVFAMSMSWCRHAESCGESVRPTVFMSLLYPYMTPGATEQLEDSWDSDAEQAMGCSVSLSLELPRGAQERCVAVEIIAEANAWKLQQEWSEV